MKAIFAAFARNVVFANILLALVFVAGGLAAINMVRAEREEEVADLADERAEERLLDLLLPPTAEPPKKEAGDESRGTPIGQIFVAGPGGVEGQIGRASCRERVYCEV